MKPADLAPILEKVVASWLKQMERKPIIPIEHKIWSEEDIALYFEYSLDYTKRCIISNEYFPPSRDLPTSVDGSRTTPRWKATDVIKYAMAFDKRTLKY